VTNGDNRPRRGEDPGWGTLGHVLLSALAPRVAARRAGSGPPLVAIRSLFAGFATAPLLIGVVVILLGKGSGASAIGVRNGCVAVAAGALVLEVAAARLVPPLRGDGPIELTASYRSRLLLDMAFSQASALLGFAVMVAADLPPWPYAVGVVACFVGLRRTAPTRRGLARDQARLVADGYRIDLLEVLTTPPADLAASADPPP
jgi:hypothetical protein